MDKLSDTSAVRVARRHLAELDAAGDDAYDLDVLPRWFGRVRADLILVLAAIDDAEGDTP